MNVETAREYCLQKMATEESFPFDEETLVFKVMGKIFACLPLNNPDVIVLKCDPGKAEQLREEYSAIEPAFHWNKKYWNQMFMSAISDQMLTELIDHSYNEVVKKLTKKQRNEILSLK